MAVNTQKATSDHSVGNSRYYFLPCLLWIDRHLSAWSFLSRNLNSSQHAREGCRRQGGLRS